MYEKLNMLVKPLEFVFMVGLPVLGLIFGGVSFGWMLGIVGTYVFLKLTGWGTKHVQEVIDETEGNIEKTKDELKKFKK
jgi:hypothetical protein